MTIAEQIDSYLKTQLEKIRTGASITLFNGTVYQFRTDAGQLVDRQLETSEHPDDMPVIVIFSGKNSTLFDERTELGRETHQLELSIEGIIASDKAGTEGDDLRLDISSAIKADPFFGGLIDELTGFTTDATTQIGDEVFTVVQIQFTVIYNAPFGSE